MEVNRKLLISTRDQLLILSWNLLLAVGLIVGYIVLVEKCG